MAKNRFLTDLEIIERVEQRRDRLNGSLRRDDAYFCGLVFGACVSACIVIGISVSLHKVYRHYWPVETGVSNPCNRCHGLAVKMTEYLKKNGSRNPEEMAFAILNTNSPRLLAAIAVKESNANSSVRKTGYKNRHDGAFQVNSKHWGAVSNNAVEQALQAEAILNDLTATMPIRKALSQYGGDSTDGYQRKILAELVRVP